MTIKFINVGRYRRNWSVEVGDREVAPAESEIVRLVVEKGALVGGLSTAAVYDELPDGGFEVLRASYSPSSGKRSGYITSGMGALRRKVGKFEVQ